MFCFQTHLGSSVHAPPQCVFYFTYILIIYIIKNNAAITREMFNFDGGTKDWRKIAHWRCCRMYQAYKFECNATSALVRANGDGSDNICNIATTRKQTNNTKNAINKCRGGDSRKHPGSPEIFRSNTWYLVNFACIQRSCTCEQLRCSFFYSFFLFATLFAVLRSTTTNITNILLLQQLEIRSLRCPRNAVCKMHSDNCRFSILHVPPSGI